MLVATRLRQKLSELFWDKIHFGTDFQNIELPVSLGMHKPRATKFCTEASNICRSAVWNLLHVTVLAQSFFFSWLLGFPHICVPLS